MHVFSHFIYISFIFLTTLSANNSSWTGEWKVTWERGTFTLKLQQNGLDVNGTFEPAHGVIFGNIVNDTLYATTIAQNKIQNKIIISMGESENAFFGNTENNTWIAGMRVSKTSKNSDYAMNLTSPKEAFYSFLALGNDVRAGDYEALSKTMNILHFNKEEKQLPHGAKLTLAVKLFQIFDECLIDKLAFIPMEQGKTQSVIFHQLGSDINVSISFFYNKEKKIWKIVVPSVNILNETLNSLLKARGKYEVDPHENVKLNHPRATMRTFFEEYNRWNHGGKKYVISTMNFLEIDPDIQKWQAPLLSFYLKSVIARLSYVIYQEIPNDPKSKKPYVYFHHAMGNIVIAPYEIDGQIKWQFTPQTLETIATLYYEMEDVQSKYKTYPLEDNNIYFGLKSFFKGLSPALLKTVYHTEFWKIVMLLSIIISALFVSILIRYMVMKFFHKFYYTKRWTEEKITLGYTRPIQIATFGMLLLYGAHQLGLSHVLFSFIKSFSHLLMVIGFTWLSYNLISIIFSILEIKARRTETDVDEIILSLIGSVARILLITVAIFLVAEIFNIPYKTVVAGLGIGGLAFAIAAKDTISNFFGSAIIIADRPFKTGDMVKIGSEVGVITHVGIRSTKIRTTKDTLLTVPNNKITHEMIDNYSERKSMRVDTAFFLGLETSKESLDTLDVTMAEYLSKHESVETTKIMLTGVNDFTNKGISFGVSFFVKSVTATKYSEIRHIMMTELAQIIKDLNITLVMIDKGDA